MLPPRVAAVPCLLVWAAAADATLATASEQAAAVSGRALSSDDECEAGPLCALSAVQLRRSMRSAAKDYSARANSKLSARSRARAGFVIGNWTEDQTLFTYQNFSDKDFLYTWVSDSGREINVTATEAMRWAGPLVLLHVLQSCPAGALASAVARARNAGKLVLHVVGVGGALEPMMDWDHFLVGPLAPREQLVLQVFGLPQAPFAGMEVRLVLNEYEDSKHVRRMGPFSRGYSEHFVFGKYHEAVNEVPGVVLALNPGFAHYPKSWWQTLRYLHSLQVPVVATGYGQSMQTIFEYMPSRVLLEVKDSQFRLPEASVREEYAENNAVAPGGGAYFIWSTAEISDYVNRDGLWSYSKHLYPPQPELLQLYVGPFVNSCSRASSTASLLSAGEEDEQVSGICSDLNGTFFLGQHAGYKVSLSTRSPFQYCDHAPGGTNCASNGVVALLEPKAAGAARAAAIQAEEGNGKAADFQAPSWLFEETARRAMGCTLRNVRHLEPCVERRLAAGPVSKKDIEDDVFDNLDQFFDTARIECCGGDYEAALGMS